MIKKLIWLGIGALLGFAPVADCATYIRTDNVDIRFGRIYIPLGEETQVYRYASMFLFQDGDTLLTTYVDHAWTGIAVSRPVDLRADTLDLTRFSATVEMADFDDSTMIRIGTDLTDLELLAPGLSTERAQLIRYNDPLTMEEDLYADLLDGTITFDNPGSAPEGIETSAYPLPYLAVMIPHIGRDWNQRGQLTTSLYYRFDATHLALGFDGDRVGLTYRFQSRPEDSPVEPFRLYQYDPERGRLLFESLSPPPSELALWSSNPALDGIVHYFADIIARDRCPVAIVTESRAADVRIEFVPLRRTLPSVTVYSLYYHLIRDSLAATAASESVRRVDATLQRVETPRSPEEYYRSLDRAGRTMMEDLGVFPLFRPTLFLHTHKRLQGITADPDGFLDFSKAALVLLPNPPEEAE